MRLISSQSVHLSYFTPDLIQSITNRLSRVENCTTFIRPSITMSRTTILTETARTPEVSPKPTLTVIKNGFGAEVTGLDFANGVTDEAYHFIRDAVTKVWFLIPENTIKALI